MVQKPRTLCIKYVKRIIKSGVLNEIVLFTISFCFRLYISNYKANSKKNILQCILFFYRSVCVMMSHTHFEIYFTLFEIRAYSDLLYVSLCFNTLLLCLLYTFVIGYRVHIVVDSVWYCTQQALLVFLFVTCYLLIECWAIVAS